MDYTAIFILTSASVAIGLAWWFLQPAETNLPPLAPGSLPIIGHLLALASKEAPERLFLKWSKEVGPVFTLKFGVKRWIVLNDSTSVKDLLVNRGTVYSSRDISSVIVDGFFDGESGGGFAFYPYGKYWRSLRKIAHSGLTKKKINDYQPIFEQATRTLLKCLDDSAAKSPGTGIPVCRFVEDYAMLTVLRVACGDALTMKPGDEDLQQVFELTAGAASFLGPKQQLLEFFPVLKWIIPQSPAFVKHFRNKIHSFYGPLFDKVDLQLAQENDDSSDCFFKEVAGQLTQTQRIGFAAVFVGAGSETTASTLQWLIALLLNHPEVQDKAYEEIISVVGKNRLPSAEDETRLPYLQCVILETLRLRTPTPLGVPHATSTSDVYKSYIIPAQATIVVNAYAIHRDTQRYNDPEAFDPTRHMEYVQSSDSNRFSQNVDDRPHLAFSTGRRVCVGIHLAERSLYMATACMLACYRFEGTADIQHSKDGLSTTFAPVPYLARLTQRHENVPILFHDM